MNIKLLTIYKMKTRTVVWCIALLFNALTACAEDIKGIVVRAEWDTPVQGADVSIFSADSLVCGLSTDKAGRFEVPLAEGVYRIQVRKDKYLTLEDSLAVSASEESRELRLILHENPVMLGEVVVKASPTYVRNLDDGIVYNLSKDRHAQKDNLLNALNRVPLLMVSSDGTVSVAGKGSYTVYLNGKPYSVANAEPAQVLRSIPASDIRQVEVVTRPAHRFGESVPVINIITKGSSIEGYHVNVNGMGGTTPKATGAASLLGIANKIQFFAGYTYDLWGQRDQQWLHEYKFGNGNSTFISSDKNHRDRHSHLGRVLFQWDADTLRQLYADFHMNGTEHDERIYYGQGGAAGSLASEYMSTSDTWDASLEANVIYLVRFKDSKAQKWRLGYRFTLNPDNRDYRIEDLSDNTVSTSKTNGRLYTHNFQLYRRVDFTRRLFSRLTLNANIRKGSSLSEYASAASVYDADDFRYTQTLCSLDWNTVWYVVGSNDLWLDLSNKLEYADDKSTDLESHRQSFSYLPSAKLTWQPNWDNEFSLAFKSGISRPSLQMLNPFIGGQVSNDVLQGSPGLKDARSYSLSLGYSFYGKRLSVHPTIKGSLTRNAIMSVFSADETFSRLIETYGNVSRVKALSLELFLSYRPWQWLTLRNVSSAGIQNISSGSMSLYQSDGFYRSTSVLTFNLPSSWKFESRFSCYKLEPKAWVRYKPGVMYGFSLSRTLMKGNMSVGAFLDCPFDRHGTSDSRTILSAPGLSYDKLWKIQHRSVGIEVSLNLRGGKKVGLKRDTSLKDTDIQSGIAN